MTKLTTESLEKFVNDIKTDGMCDITDHQVESALIQLLAYEQAADRPVGEIFRCSGNKTLRWWNDVPEGTVLYAAPVLPKQPEHSRQHFESLCNQFWNWAELDEIDQDEEPRLEWNGSNYTHRVTAALWKMYQAAPAQPVSEPYKLPDGWVMVPQQIFLDASDIESICSQCGDGHKSGYGDFTDGLLWVGDIQCDNGTIMHGLHISSSDYQEEGGLTLAEFKAPVQEPK